MKKNAMKKLSLLSALLFAVLAMNAQLQEEGFSNSTISDGWTSSNATSGCDWSFGYTGEMPNSGTPASTFPSGAAFFDDGVCGALSNDLATLTGPVIDMSSITNSAIEVVYNLQVFAGKGIFKIEAFDGVSWQEVFFQDEDSPRNTGTNQTVSLDVSPYLNSAFQVRFVYHDEGLQAWGLAIDHYKLINSSVASVDDLVELGFNYYPNPSQNILNLSAKENIRMVNIYNILGQEVLSEKPTRTVAQIDLSDLSMGAYFVKVLVDDKRGSFKIIKE